MAAVRLLAVDVDGTLLDDRHRLVPKNVAALRAAQDAEIHVVLASSRPPRGIIPLFHAAGLQQGIVVAYQGAMCLDVLDGVADVFDERPIPLATAQEVCAKAIQAGGDVNWYDGDAWLCSAVTPRVEMEARIVGYRPELAQLRTLTRGAHKLLILGPAGSEAAILDAIKSADVEAEISKPGYVEVTHRGVDKGHALRAVLARKGLAAIESMAIGDGANDLAMLRVAGTSVAMGNAPESIRDAAMYVTSTNDEAGVAKAIWDHAVQW